MKECPNCKELLGNSVNECFKCRYNFTLKKVITATEHASRKYHQIEEQKKKEEELKLREEIKNKQLLENPLYEYKLIVINDLSSGEVNARQIQTSLDYWSERGWKLHSIYSSEIGKETTSTSFSGFGAGVCSVSKKSSRSCSFSFRHTVSL